MMKNEIIHILKNWVAIKSIYDEKTADERNPFGIYVSQALQYFCDLGYKNGFVWKNMGNKVAYIEYGAKGEEYVEIFGHCDVVDADVALWKYDTFNITLEGDKIIGRGVSDNKGGMVACFLALLQIKKEKIKLKRTVRLICGGNEESGFECIRHYYKTEPKGIYGLVPDAKFPIINGEKGSCIIVATLKMENKNIKINMSNGHNVIPSYVQIDIGSETLKINGIGGHSSKPEKANNPIIKALKYLYDIDLDCNILNIYNLVCDENRDGKILNLNQEGKCGVTSIAPTVLNIENGMLELVIDLRYPENITYTQICKNFNTYIYSSNCNVKFSFKNFKNANYIDSNCMFIKDLHNIYINHTNDTRAKIRTTNAGTYASEMQNAIIFGCEFPDGSSGGVHKEDEFNSITSIEKAIKIYKDAIIHLSNVL